MIGRVAFINPATQTGIVFGSDRIRYTFSLADWSDAQPPQRNQDINIVVQDGRVTASRPLGDEFLGAPEEPEPVVAAPKAKAPRAGTPEVPLQAIESFRGQMEYGASDATIAPEEPEYAERPLDNGEAFPEMFKADPDMAAPPPIGKLLFTMGDSRASRSKTKLYAIGAGIAALLAVAGLAASGML